MSKRQEQGMSALTQAGPFIILIHTSGLVYYDLGPDPDTGLIEPVSTASIGDLIRYRERSSMAWFGVYARYDEALAELRAWCAVAMVNTDFLEDSWVGPDPYTATELQISALYARDEHESFVRILPVHPLAGMALNHTAPLREPWKSIALYTQFPGHEYESAILRAVERARNFTKGSNSRLHTILNRPQK